MSNFPFVPMEVVERSQYDGGTYFLIQTASDRDGWEVAEVRPDIPWQLKTAQLLAAAPDLLEQLESAMRQMDMAGDCIEKGLYDEALLHVRCMIRPKREAVAKAKGDKP